MLTLYELHHIVDFMTKTNIFQYMGLYIEIVEARIYLVQDNVVLILL